MSYEVRRIGMTQPIVIVQSQESLSQKAGGFPKVSKEMKVL